MLDDSTLGSHDFLGDPHQLLAYNLIISDPNPDCDAERDRAAAGWFRR
jgi:hypothetical protein